MGHFRLAFMTNKVLLTLPTRRVRETSRQGTPNCRPCVYDRILTVLFDEKATPIVHMRNENVCKPLRHMGVKKKFHVQHKSRRGWHQPPYI